MAVVLHVGGCRDGSGGEASAAVEMVATVRRVMVAEMVAPTVTVAATDVVVAVAAMDSSGCHGGAGCHDGEERRCMAEGDGSYRSGYEEPFWGLPENLAGKTFRRWWWWSAAADWWSAAAAGNKGREKWSSVCDYL
nr:hypothetical protein [Tanacetum cinerariifolium]